MCRWRKPACTTHEHLCLRTNPRASTRRLSVSGHRSVQRDASSLLFHLPLKLVGQGVGSAERRQRLLHGALGRLFFPPLMTATESPNADTLFASTPQLRAQLTRLRTTLSRQTKSPAFLLKPRGPAIHTNTTPKHLSNPSNYNSTNNRRQPRHCIHQHSHTHLPNPTPTPVHTSNNPTAKPTNPKDRCFRVSMATRLMLPHPAVPGPSGIATACPNESATGLICAKPVDAHQHLCSGCRYSGGRRSPPRRSGPMPCRRHSNAQRHQGFTSHGPCV